MAIIRPPRILLSTRNMRGLSGKIVLIKQNIKALVEAGWEVTVYAEKADHQALESLGANTVGIWNRAFSKPAKLRRFLNKHEDLAHSGRFDLVVAHGETLCQDVLHIHNARHMEHEHIYGTPMAAGQMATADIQARQLAEKRYRLLVANSCLMKNDLLARYAADPQSIAVVYPGFDPRRFYPDRDSVQSRELRSRLNPDDKILVGLITSGKLVQRGADLLIAAIAGLPAGVRSRIRTVIVAKDDLESYQRLAEQAGLASSIGFLEPLPNVEALYNALDIYINPARIETFGMALLEAMACGVPSITTRDKVGAAELFSADMQVGLMEQADPESLATTLQRFVESGELRRTQAVNCMAAATPHDWANNTRQHMGLYETLLEQKKQKYSPALGISGSG